MFTVYTTARPRRPLLPRARARLDGVGRRLPAILRAPSVVPRPSPKDSDVR
jgi:hypothetical protein